MLPKDSSRTAMRRGVDMPRAAPPPQPPCAGQDPLPKLERSSISPAFTLVTTFRRHISRMAIKRHLKGLATKTAVQRQAVPLPAGPGELLSFQSGKDRLPGQETKVQSLEEEDPPEEEMATHSSLLA